MIWVSSIFLKIFLCLEDHISLLMSKYASDTSAGKRVLRKRSKELGFIMNYVEVNVYCRFFLYEKVDGKIDKGTEERKCILEEQMWEIRCYTCRTMVWLTYMNFTAFSIWNLSCIWRSGYWELILWVLSSGSKWGNNFRRQRIRKTSLNHCVDHFKPRGSRVLPQAIAPMNTRSQIKVELIFNQYIHTYIHICMYMFVINI